MLNMLKSEILGKIFSLMTLNKTYTIEKKKELENKNRRYLILLLRELQDERNYIP